MSDYDWCPDCGAHGSKVTKDFDPDVGYFYQCEICNSCWSVQEKLVPYGNPSFRKKLKGEKS